MLRHIPFLAAALLLIGSCGDPSGPGTPRSIVLTSGGDQVGVAGMAFAAPITVTVLDGADRPVPGVEVTWSVETGGGTLDRSVGTTDRDGRASVQWTAGTASGTQRVRASAGAVGSVVVELVVEAGAVATIHAVSGTAAVGEPGTDLPHPLGVLLRDAYGNPAAGRSVRFTASSGMLGDTLPTTNAAGQVGTGWRLGAAGMATVQVSVPDSDVGFIFPALAIARADVPVLENGVPVTGLDASDGTPRLYRVQLPDGVTRFVVRTEGEHGDADLYLRSAAYPSIGFHDCTSRTPQSIEECLVLNPAVTDWFVLLDAWADYTDLTLTAEWVIAGSLEVSVAGVAPGNADVSVSGPHGFQKTLDESAVLENLEPGTYTITADHVQLNDSVYVATPAVQQVDVRANARAVVDVTYAVNTDAVNLDIVSVHITQSVQRADGSVPLVTGRDALLRVFGRANAVTSARPDVQVHVYHDDVLVYVRTGTAPAGGAPVVPDQERLSGSWNIPLPGHLIRPGLSLVVDIDPDNEVIEANEDDNVYPADGSRLEPDVRFAPQFMARMIPVLQSPTGLTGDVSGSNLASYVDLTFAVYPLVDMDVDVGSIYTFTGTLASQYDSTWNRLLQEIALLRTVAGTQRYYYGVVKPSYTRGGTGFAYIGHPAAVGVDWANHRAETVAHEWGHNFGRRHVACGGPANPDPNYPHPTGRVAHPGWDIHTGTLHTSLDRYDLMSYCNPTWSSDYTYEAVLDFREEEAGLTTAAEPALVVWGRITDDGVVLEPAFETVTRPVLPEHGVRYTLRISADDGATLATLRFDGEAIGHAPGARHFAYAVPLRMLRGRAPAELRLSGAGADVVRPTAPASATAPDVHVTRIDANRIRVQWDARQSPLAVIRDAHTGAVLSFARSGSALVASDARELQVDLSNGVRSHVLRRVEIR